MELRGLAEAFVIPFDIIKKIGIINFLLISTILYVVCNKYDNAIISIHRTIDLLILYYAGMFAITIYLLFFYKTY